MAHKDTHIRSLMLPFKACRSFMVLWLLAFPIALVTTMVRPPLVQQNSMVKQAICSGVALVLTLLAAMHDEMSAHVSHVFPFVLPICRVGGLSSFH